MNPKHARKMTRIEDFVQVLPTSAETNLADDPVSQSQFIIGSLPAIMPDPLLNEDLLAIEYNE